MLENPLGNLLNMQKTRVRKSRRYSSGSVERGFLLDDQRDWLEGVFDRMLINSEAFVKHRARNVYNDAYALSGGSMLGVRWIEYWKS